MFQNLSIFQSAGQLARHSAARQVVVAHNIANADMPGYKTRDISSFRDAMPHGPNGSSGSSALRTSRVSHIAAPRSSETFRSHAVSSTEQKPNGNTVFIETETLKAIEAERAHSRALAVYQSSLSILKTSIGRRG